MKRLALAAVLFVSVLGASSARATVSLSPVTSVSGAIYVTSPPGDDRLFIVTQGGTVRVFKNGTLQTTPFLDIGNLVTNVNERGMFSIAFPNDYASSGRFYVNYTGTAAAGGSVGDVHVDEFIDSDTSDDVAISPPRRQLLTVPHSAASNHNGGNVHVGPDGLLYITIGDGGGGQSANAQNLSSLLGKVLRIDPLGNALGGGNYSAGPGQPFTVGGTTAAPEIFAYGLRNPFRGSFDRLTGDFSLGDVGEGSFEEIDFVPNAQMAPGINFGWNNREGLHPFGGGGPLAPGSFETKPVYDYGRTVGSTVIGGYVVRDPASALYGQYVFGDFGSDKLSAICLRQPAATNVRELGVTVSNLNSFGEDSAGRLYAVSNGGGISRVVATGDEGTCALPGPAPPTPPTPTGSVTVNKRQPVARRGYVKVIASCDVACSLAARATFKRKGVDRSLRSRLLRKSLTAGQRVTLKIKVSAATRAALRRALRAKRRTTATVTIGVVGGKSPKPVKLTITG